jgi:hypothetical protein
MKILVIDDTLDPRQIWLQSTLTALGHQVDMTFDADTALDLMSNYRYDLVFFDHDLGDGQLDGSAIAGRVLYDPELYQVPRAAWVHSSNPEGALNIGSKFWSAKIPVIIEEFSVIQERGVDEFQSKINSLTSGREPNIPIGTVVDVVIDMSQPGTEDEIEINLSGPCRLFVVGHDRAGDGTPLYTLSDIPVRYPDASLTEERLVYRSLATVLEAGYEESLLTPTGQSRMLFLRVKDWMGQLS